MSGNESKKAINQIKTSLKMPKKLTIGDSIYFEETTDENTSFDSKNLIYANSFRRPNWLGSVKIIEEEVVFATTSSIRTLNTIHVKMYFAPSNESLQTYESGSYYTHQTFNHKPIPVDSSRYIFNFNDKTLLVKAETEGCLANVVEFKHKNKLEGLMIDLDTGFKYSFEEIQKMFEELLDIQF